MIEALVTLLVGSIVVCSVLMRYKTAGSAQSVKNMQITTFIFAAFASGLCITNANKVFEIYHLSTDGALPKLLVFASPAIIPFVLVAIRGRWNNDYADYVDYSMKGGGIAVVTLLIALMTDSKIFLLFYFTSVIIAIGFFHALLGSIVAGVNIAMIVSHLLIQGKFGFDLATTFDLLEKIGVTYAPIKWAIVISSTTLSFHSFIQISFCWFSILRT